MNENDIKKTTEFYDNGKDVTKVTLYESNHIKNNLMQNVKFKGIFIPKHIWLRNDLNWLQKNLIMEIDLFCEFDSIEELLDGSWKNEKSFYGSNKYLAKLFDISATRISQLLNDLKRKGLLDIRHIKKKDEYDNIVQERYVMITAQFCALKAGLINLETPLTPLIYKRGTIKYKTPPIENFMHSINGNSINSIELLSKDNNNIFPEEKILEKKILKNNIPNKNKSKINNPKLNKNNKSPNNKKDIINNNFSQSFVKSVLVWNSARKPASNHKLEKPTKTLNKAHKYYNALKTGLFINYCTNVTNDWLKKIGLDPKKIKNKKWKDNEIRNVLRNCIKQFDEGYYPFSLEEKKRILPKTLADTFYSPYNSSCPSVFLKIYANPPKENTEYTKDVKIKYELTTEKYLNEFFEAIDLNKKEKNTIIRNVNTLVDEYDKIVDKKIKVGNKYYYRRDFEVSNFRVHFMDYDEFINEHINYINRTLQKNKTLDPEVVMRTTNGFWKSFINYYENKHDIEFYPDESYLRSLCDEYLESKNN